MPRLFAIPLALLIVVSTYAQKSSKPLKEDSCSVSGIVVKMAGSAPLRKARLRPRSVDDPNRVIYAITNEEGRFALKGIEPGPYRLTVSRVGFVTEEYGQRKPNTGGAVLTLRPGQETKDLLLRLSRSGVISGKLFDEDGEPLPSVTVECFRQVYSEGKRSRTTETNDLGEYRLFGLPPGRYFVSSLYPHWTRVGEDDDSPIGESQEEAYAKLFYPGTADVSKAGPVIVKPGDEISSTDILMTKVIVHRVRGQVYNQVTHKPGVGVDLLLLPKTTSREWDSPNQAQVQKSDGSFVLKEVLPGSYMLVSFWFDDGIQYVNRQEIAVGNADVEGVAVTVAPGMNIGGRIVWDGQPGIEKDEVRVILQSVRHSFWIWSWRGRDSGQYFYNEGHRRGNLPR